VISYKDIEEAQVKRTAKDAIKGKGKHGRKHKSNVLDADEPEAPEPEPEVARAAKEVIKGRGKRGQKRKSTALEPDEPEPEAAQIIDAPVLRRAPVALII
jgi:hypothetical protein